MSDAAKKLMDDALALPSEERKRLGVALLDSVDDEGIRELLLERIGEFERGEVETRDAMDIYHRLMATRSD